MYNVFRDFAVDVNFDHAVEWHRLTNFWLFFLESDSVLSCCALGSCSGSSDGRAFHVVGLRYHAPYFTFTQLGVYFGLA